MVVRKREICDCVEERVFAVVREREDCHNPGNADGPNPQVAGSYKQAPQPSLKAAGPARLNLT